MKNQKGGALILAIAGLVLVSGLVLASISILTEQAETSRDAVNNMQGTAISDSLRLFLLKGYDAEVAASFLAEEIYGSSLSFELSNDVYDGKLRVGNRYWGYAFELSPPVEDLKDLYEALDYDLAALPPQCSPRSSGSFVCNWQAGVSNSWRAPLPQGVAPRIESNSRQFVFSGVMRFPPNTQFILGKSVELYFEDPVVFGGDFSVRRNHPDGGSIYFHDTVAVLGELQFSEYLNHGSFSALGGEIVFSQDSFIQRLQEYSTPPVRGNSPSKKLDNYRVSSAFYYGEIDWEGPRNLSLFSNQSGMPARVRFDASLTSENGLPYYDSLTWTIVGEKRDRCGTGNCWLQKYYENKTLDVILISEFCQSSLETSNIFSNDQESLLNIVLESYSSESWTIVNLDS